jgi:hypothetical protein
VWGVRHGAHWSLCGSMIEKKGAAGGAAFKGKQKGLFAPFASLVIPSTKSMMFSTLKRAAGCTDWRVVRGVWGVRHGDAAWGLVIQH